VTSGDNLVGQVGLSDQLTKSLWRDCEWPTSVSYHKEYFGIFPFGC